MRNTFFNSISRYFVATVFSLTVTTACGSDNVTAPTTIKPIEHGWQVVFQAKSWTDVAPVVATRANSFTEPTLNDIVGVGPSGAVIDLKNMSDTVWVGYAVYTQMDMTRFGALKVQWYLTGNMIPSSRDSTRIAMGSMIALWETHTYDFNFNEIGMSSWGKHDLTTAKNDFLFSAILPRTGKEYKSLMLAIMWAPMVCKDFVSRSFTSTGIAQTQTDGPNRFDTRLNVPDFAMTCNPPAPMASVAASNVKLVDMVDKLH